MMPKRTRGQPLQRLLVVGLGNPILGDDGVGWQVAERVKELVPQVTVVCLALGGLSLMEHLIGCDHAILVDSLHLPDCRSGRVVCLPLEAMPEPSTGHTTAVHDASLQTALTVGRSMGAQLPETVTVVGIETECVYEFDEALTPPVAAAVPEAVRQVLSLLERYQAL